MTNKVQNIIDNITKGGVAASVLSDDDSPCVVSAFISTGCCVLDIIMGGGLPLGRIVEIYGDTSTGKSLIAAQACAYVQDTGGLAVYIDTEAAVSMPIMRAVGVDVDNLVYVAPDTCEAVFKVMVSVLESRDDNDESPLLIVWDSIAATSSEAEMGKDIGETGYLTQARVISQGLRKLTRLIAREKVAVLFLNQSKTKIGVMWGDQTATFGGKAPGFHSSIRMQLKQGKKLKQGTKIVGMTCKVRVTKNKVAPPFREAQLPIYFGFGIDEPEAALLALKDAGVAKWVGGWWRYGDEKFRKAQWPDIFDNVYDDVYDTIESWYDGEDL